MEETPQIICYIKEKQREYKQGSDAYNVLRSLEVTLPNMLIDFVNEGKWVRVEERLPEEDGTYMVGNPRYESNTCYFEDGKWEPHHLNPYIHETITHWQPIPKPPNTN